MIKSPNTPKPKWRRRADDRPHEVMDAALDLFMDKGFAATRVADIARRAGLSKGAIYLYFDSKEAILKGLIERSIIPVVENSETLARNLPGDPQTTIRMILTQAAERMSDPRLIAIPRLMIAEAGNFPELAKMYRREVIDRGFRTLEALLEEGIEKGIFRRLNARLAIRNIFGPVIIHSLLSNVFQIDNGENEDPEQFLASHLDILFNGLLAKPEGA